MGMKGTPERQSAIYHTFNVEDLIESGHPLRAIKRMVDRALADMSRTFRAAYSDTGRPSIPPETLLKALLFQCLYTIRSERELCRRLKTDLLCHSGQGEQRSAAFRKSQRRRKLVEEFFGWAKTVAGMRRARHVGREKIKQCFDLAAAAYNLVRMTNLLAA